MCNVVLLEYRMWFMRCVGYFFYFKQETAYEISACLVGSDMCIRGSCRGENAQYDLKEWYEAAFTHVQEASKAMRDLPAEDEEHDNVLQVPEGAHRNEGSSGGHSLAQVLSELGVNGNWAIV